MERNGPRRPRAAQLVFRARSVGGPASKPFVFGATAAEPRKSRRNAWTPPPLAERRDRGPLRPWRADGDVVCPGAQVKEMRERASPPRGRGRGGDPPSARPGPRARRGSRTAPCPCGARASLARRGRDLGVLVPGGRARPAGSAGGSGGIGDGIGSSSRFDGDRPRRSAAILAGTRLAISGRARRSAAPARRLARGRRRFLSPRPTPRRP